MAIWPYDHMPRSRSVGWKFSSMVHIPAAVNIEINVEKEVTAVTALLPASTLPNLAAEFRDSWLRKNYCRIVSRVLEAPSQTSARVRRKSAPTPSLQRSRVKSAKDLAVSGAACSLYRQARMSHVFKAHVYMHVHRLEGSLLSVDIIARISHAHNPIGRLTLPSGSFNRGLQRSRV